MNELIAETLIEHDDAATAATRMHQDHEEFLVSPAEENTWQFRLHYGSISMELRDRRLKIRVFAADETCLSYMKMDVAHHMQEYLGSTEGISWSGDGNTSTVPVFFREITVVSSERITPHMQRLRFSAENIARFAVGGFHVRILIPPQGRTPVWPTVSGDGLLNWPQGEDALTVRIYTIRSIDVERGLFDIDFVLHPGLETPAALFAQTAQSGDVIGMIGPGGENVPEAANVMLFGDDTALPAISRMLDNLPEDRRAEVYIEVNGPEDVQALPAKNASLRWLFRAGRPAGTTGLLSETLRKIDPSTLPEDIYVWAGCEFSDFKEIRKIVRKEWGIPKERQLVVAYWRRGAEGDEARKEAA
ncbi:siderophore-interacting protein [Rhizobium sp. LCM 4573]|uniref:siderophore-interacting protein n=1 Tax=Rhizobium sp. LCM 4573 TaxID=1848291 RepID=UPI0008DAD212|nr:siderophore-interacting protein [Rhizobium sp. LCM 4573]OHV84257.1 NADPH-dependent ferric siderophore reductase [Rhizobium sp. LCM 4573]